MDNNIQNITQGNDSEQIEEFIEGLDESQSVGWDEYPLDSVFVRTEQRTVSEVVKRIKNGRYILNTDFQRDIVWSIKQQSRLIESCLMRIPLPVFYVAEEDDGKIIVVDGLQRLTTFHKYLNNEFALSKLGNDEENSEQINFLVGKHFKDLPINLQERVEDTQLILYILDPKVPQRAKLDIFERVNGGTPLTRQQMRNCLFNGPATKWLGEVSETREFLDATNGSLPKKTMRDRQAINHFCAFKLLEITQYQGDIDDFLAKALEKMNKFSPDMLEDLKRGFKNSMLTNYQLFGTHAFRKSLGSKDSSVTRSELNIPLFGCCSVSLTDVEQPISKQKENLLRNAIKKVLRDRDFFDAITYSTNATKQVNLRFKMMNSAIEKVLKSC